MLWFNEQHGCPTAIPQFYLFFAITDTPWTPLDTTFNYGKWFISEPPISLSRDLLCPPYSSFLALFLPLPLPSPFPFLLFFFFRLPTPILPTFLPSNPLTKNIMGKSCLDVPSARTKIPHIKTTGSFLFLSAPFLSGR